MPRLRRRSMLLAVPSLALTAGCVGVLTGQEALSFGADPVTVSSAAQDDAGYEQVRRASPTTTREFSAAGQTREVAVTNQQVEYARSVDVGPVGTGELARFVAVATPAVQVLGRTFNPVGDLSNRELAAQLQDDYEGLGDLQPAGERTVAVLGSDATVSTFTGEAALDDSGPTVEVTLHVTRVRHQGDFVVAVAIHPSVLEGEPARVDAMLAGLQHG